MGLRTKENVVPDVKTNACADVTGEMFAAHVVCAAYESAVRYPIKSESFPTESSHQLALHFFAESRRPKSVEIIQNGAEGKSVCVQVLTGSPGYLTLNSYLVMVQEEYVGTEAGK